MAAGVSTGRTGLIEGPEVRIRLPPAESRVRTRLTEGKGGADMAARVLAIRTVSRVASACRRAAKVRSFADHFVLRRGICEITGDDQPGGDPDTRLQPFRRGQRSDRLGRPTGGIIRRYYG